MIDLLFLVAHAYAQQNSEPMAEEEKEKMIKFLKHLSPAQRQQIKETTLQLNMDPTDLQLELEGIPISSESTSQL